MAWHPSKGSPGEKLHHSGDFRRSFPASVVIGGPQEVKRHMFDCELAAAAAAYMRGPRMSQETVDSYKSAISSGSNVHYYGSERANTVDRLAANKVLQSAYTQERVTLSAHEASHIRSGAAWLASNKDQFSPGYIRSASKLYENVYDQDGHKVVDRRSLRTGK